MSSGCEGDTNKGRGQKQCSGFISHVMSVISVATRESAIDQHFAAHTTSMQDGDLQSISRSSYISFNLR